MGRLQVGVEIGGMQAALGKLFQPDGILYGIMAGPDALMKVAAPILEPILGSFSTQLKEILDKVITRPSAVELLVSDGPEATK